MGGADGLAESDRSRASKGALERIGRLPARSSRERP
jgi:hypothetical protein